MAVRAPSLARRIVVTIAAPLLLSLIADRLYLPGIHGEAAERFGGAPLGVFALGVTPIITAYVLVELAALVIPGLSRLRHAGPEARAKLDVGVRVLALVMAAWQAFGVATTINASVDEYTSQTLFGEVSVPLITFTLIGGVCVTFVVAALVTRQRIVNGYALFLGAGALRSIVTDLEKAFGLGPTPSPARGMLGLFSSAPHVSTPLGIAVILGAIAIAAFVSWVALAHGGVPPREEDRSESEGPYRRARTLAVAPWVPIPSSSFSAYFLAGWLLLLPTTLSAFVPKQFDSLAAFARGDASTPLMFVFLLFFAAVLTLILHRPRELADLASHLGASPANENRSRKTVLLAIAPTFLFFASLELLALEMRVSPAEVPLVVAVVIDLVRGIRDAGCVAVWEERRAAAVPVLRAVLASDGIPSRVNGMAMLSLWQFFAPYAPAQIMVAPENAERAVRVVRHVTLGEEAPPRAETPEKEPPRERAWSFARRTAILGVVAMGSLVMVLVSRADLFAASYDEPSAPPAKLEVVFVDDTLDFFGRVEDESLPDGAGIAIYQENAPVAPAQSTRVHFARITTKQGEKRDQTQSRFRAWLATLHPPDGTRIGIEEIDEVDEDTAKSTFVGYRTFLLTGAPVLQNEDVEDAAAAMDQGNGAGSYYVGVTLTKDGAKKFEDATRAWTNRRMAIVLDDVIESAPVIKSVIGGGRLSITMGAGDPEKQLADARRLERGLRQKHKHHTR